MTTPISFAVRRIGRCDRLPVSTSIDARGADFDTLAAFAEEAVYDAPRSPRGYWRRGYWAPFRIDGHQFRAREYRGAIEIEEGAQ